MKFRMTTNKLWYRIECLNHEDAWVPVQQLERFANIPARCTYSEARTILALLEQGGDPFNFQEVVTS